MVAAAAASQNARKKAHANDDGGHKKPKQGHADTAVREPTPKWQYVPPDATETFAGTFTGWRKYQPQAKWLYAHIYVQVGVAGLIVFNFLANIVQAQIDPAGTDFVDEFGVFEWFFNIAFIIELVLNMYSSWVAEFWRGPNASWNIFDFSVVVIGWLFQLQVPLPGPLKLLRMMRAFRVFRLFKRIASLRKILTSLANAVPGVMNAFLIQLIVMCIYAIIAVDVFGDYGEGFVMTNELDVVIELKTGRDQEYGFEYFGDFGKSLFTMFQVLTGESWSEVVCRPLFHSNNPTTSVGAAFFFVSFMIINGIVLINVVIAVLLEKMVDGGEESKDDGEEANPLEEAVEETKTQAEELTKRLEHLTEISAGMQKQLADVDTIKEQLAKFLSHNGIKVAPRPPYCPPSPGLTATAHRDDPNGFQEPHAPSQAPQTLDLNESTPA